MDQSKARLALAESMQLHRERVDRAQKRLHAAQQELESAAAELQIVIRGQELFVASMRGSQRTHQLPYDGSNKRHGAAHTLSKTG